MIVGAASYVADQVKSVNSKAEDFNVLDGPLHSCGLDPITGYHRDGQCRTGRNDLGRHTVCAVVTDDFLRYSQSQGNDLITPVTSFGFPGLVAGDRWCLCANRWLQAHHAGVAPQLYLQATHRSTLDVIEFDTLLNYALDLPKHA